MAGRQHAAIRLDMWSDDDWRSRTIHAQWLYLFLMTTETLNYSGVADWREARIAGHAVDLDQRKVVAAAAELERHHFIVTDPESEEVLIRSFLRHDGLLNKPNVTKAMVKAFKMVVSPIIRGVIVHELSRLADEFPEWSAWGSDEVQIILTKPSINAKERVSQQIAKGSTKGSESDASLLTPYSLLLTPNTSHQKSVQKPARSISDEFAEWWTVYPRKQGKADALKAYTIARRKNDAAVLMSGARAYALLAAGEDKSFVKLPGGWLRGERWADEQLSTSMVQRRPAPLECDLHEGYPLPCESCARAVEAGEGASW